MPKLIELPPGEEVVWFCGVPFRFGVLTWLGKCLNFWAA